MPRLVKIKWNRGGHFKHTKCTSKQLNKKMPKIDTLDALDDEMTSILNTL